MTSFMCLNGKWCYIEILAVLKHSLKQVVVQSNVSSIDTIKATHNMKLTISSLTRSDLLFSNS